MTKLLLFVPLETGIKEVKSLKKGRQKEDFVVRNKKINRFSETVDLVSDFTVRY